MLIAFLFADIELQDFLKAPIQKNQKVFFETKPSQRDNFKYKEIELIDLKKPVKSFLPFEIEDPKSYIKKPRKQSFIAKLCSCLNPLNWFK
jgi:hypothetical protein